MITQASNRPLVIGLPFSVTDATEIHVELYNSVETIQHWDEDDLTVSTDGKALICPMTQADTAAMAAGRASCVVKALVDGVVMQTQKMPISIKAYHDHTIMGDDDPITEYDVTYTGSLEEPQGILNPESIRTAIVIRAGTVPDDVAEEAVTAWMTAHAAQIKGEPGRDGTNGTNGANGADAKINGVNTLTMVAGSNITLDQSGSTLTISSTGGGGGGSTAWADITGKPSTFTPSAHSHAQSDINGLSTALAGKAASSHTHSYNDLTNKPTIPAAVTDDHIAEVAATVVPSDDITANTDARHTHSNKSYLDGLSDSYINGLIDAKITPLETLSTQILGVL